MLLFLVKFLEGFWHWPCRKPKSRSINVVQILQARQSNNSNKMLPIRLEAIWQKVKQPPNGAGAGAEAGTETEAEAKFFHGISVRDVFRFDFLWPLLLLLFSLLLFVEHSFDCIAMSWPNMWAGLGIVSMCVCAIRIISK